MAIINDFEYFKPLKIEEALALLSKHKNKAKLLAGGTDIIVHLKEDLIKPDVVIDIKGLTRLDELNTNDDKIFIGANVTFTELIKSDLIRNKLPILWSSSKTVASVGIRNRATLTGNICSAVPSLDSAPALLIYNAEVLVQSSTGKRNISIHDWFTGPKKTCLKSEELVIGISIIVPQEHSGTYEKLGRYKGEDLAQAGIGIFVDHKRDYRFASCAVGPIPKRLKKLENYLSGKLITDQLILEAIEMIPSEISPITDIRAQAEYRIHMMQVMFKRGLRESLDRLTGGKK